MKTTQSARKSMLDLSASTTKAIDYLHRQFPWKNREVIANIFQEAGANFARALKMLSSTSSNTFQTQPVLAN